MSAPGNGSMQIRLDPPELGALKVSIEMANGQMTATFQTSNEQATQLLSHSLNQLKHVLESQGVAVDRLQVQQAPKNEHSSAGDDSRQQQQSWSDDHAARQEQQRKEMLKRMWRKVTGAGDPIDFFA
jgi:flagellar hook-length control protein FliK